MIESFSKDLYWMKYFVLDTFENRKNWTEKEFKSIGPIWFMVRGSLVLNPFWIRLNTWGRTRVVTCHMCHSNTLFERRTVIKITPVIQFLEIQGYASQKDIKLPTPWTRSWLVNSIAAFSHLFEACPSLQVRQAPKIKFEDIAEV